MRSPLRILICAIISTAASAFIGLCAEALGLPEDAQSLVAIITFACVFGLLMHHLQLQAREN